MEIQPDDDTFDIYGDDLGNDLVDGDGKDMLYDEMPSAKKQKESDDYDFNQADKNGIKQTADDDVFDDFGGVEKDSQPHSTGEAPAPQAYHKEEGQSQIKSQGNICNSLYVSELHWWTTDEDLISVAKQADIDSIDILDISFYEHKVNGKSRGVAFMLFKSSEIASKCRDFMDQKEINGKKCVAAFSGQQQGNPFRIVPKEPPTKLQKMIPPQQSQQQPQQPQPPPMMGSQRFPPNPSMPMPGGNFPRPYRSGMVHPTPYGSYPSYPNQRPRGAMMQMGQGRPPMGRGYMQAPPGSEQWINPPPNRAGPPMRGVHTQVGYGRGAPGPYYRGRGGMIPQNAPYGVQPMEEDYYGGVGYPQPAPHYNPAFFDREQGMGGGEGGEVYYREQQGQQDYGKPLVTQRKGSMDSSSGRPKLTNDSKERDGGSEDYYQSDRDPPAESYHKSKHDDVQKSNGKRRRSPTPPDVRRRSGSSVISPLREEDEKDLAWVDEYSVYQDANAGESEHDSRRRSSQKNERDQDSSRHGDSRRSRHRSRSRSPARDSGSHRGSVSRKYGSSDRSSSHRNERTTAPPPSRHRSRSRRRSRERDRGSRHRSSERNSKWSR